MKQIRKRLTYANVMSSIAVFLMIGGATAIAAGLAKNSVGPKQLKKNAVTTKKIKINAVTTAKIKNNAVTGPKVNEATLGEVPSAASAKTAATANTANTATVGSPAAYALIEFDGTVVLSEPNRGITSAQVSNPFEGIYCIDLAFAPKTASAEPLSEGAEDTIISIELGGPYNDCPATAEVEVRTYDAGNAAEEDEAFWVQIDS